ncbi:MAG: hypothetical protein ACI8W3_000979 [Myxococcota bacterium]
MTRQNTTTKRNYELAMQNDKVFITYALTLIVGTASLLAFVVISSAPSIPSAAYLLEHLTLGLMVRAYYKSFDGERGFYALANGIKRYFGIARDAIPTGGVPVTN